MQGTQYRAIDGTRSGPVSVRRPAGPVGASNGVYGRFFTC